MALSDAELVVGLARHLRVYQMSAERAALDELEFAGQIFDVAFRLRGSTTNTAARVRAIGLEVGLGNRQLRDVIATMESLRWVTVTRDVGGSPVSVAESIPAPVDLIASSDRILAVVAITDAQRAALAILRATTLQPLLDGDAVAVGLGAAGGDEQSAADGLRHLEHTGLLRRVRADDGREVLFNPNIWTQGEKIADATLRAADSRATSEVRALLEEVSANPGMPDSKVTSTERRWVDFAVSQGFVQRSVIQTAAQREEGFLFTPHLGRDPFGGPGEDASGQVRQLVGSMVYASTFATYRLRDPSVFLRRLISRGVAGDVSSIGTDYPMLEKAGIVRVVPGSTSNRFRLELLQSNVAESAVEILEQRNNEGDGGQSSALSITGQRSYRHLEQERAQVHQIAKNLNVDEVEQARLIAALRDESIWNPSRRRS